MIVPLVLVNDTLYGFASVELQERVAVPEPITLFGVTGDGQTNPAGGVPFAKFTVPAKPFKAVTVMVDVAVEPTVADAGDATTAKSCT